MKQIPQKVLDEGYTKKVHVEGWNPKYAFFYVATGMNGVHLLRNNTGKLYNTSNNLLYTRKHEPVDQIEEINKEFAYAAQLKPKHHETIRPLHHRGA